MQRPVKTLRAGLMRRTLAPLAFGLATIVAWLALSLLTDRALMADNIEQEVWAHSFEWGYHKHPPLPTWLLIAAQALAGPQWWLTPVLAALCLGVTLVATFFLARHLAGARVAQLTALLWGLHLGLTWRSTLYNHNTVLVALAACLAWATWRATQSPGIGRWTTVGLLAGAALLAKYQAVVMLGLLAVLVPAQGRWREPRLHRGMAVAALTCLLLVGPHLLWLMTHDWGPLRHAGKHLPDAWGWQHIGHTLGFLAQQARVFWPALALVAVASLLARRHKLNNLTGPAPQASQERLWLQALIFGPPAVVLTLGLLGIHLQNHWGLQSFQFASVGLAWLLRRRSTLGIARMMLLAVLLHAALAASHVHHARQQAQAWNGRGDRHFPAQALAQAAMNDWRAVTRCPLRYTVGWQFEAGLLSVYSGEHPQVFESGSIGASPWIDVQQLQPDGAIYVAYAQQDLPPQAARYGAVHLTHTPEPPAGGTLHWAVVAPQADCTK